MTLIEQLSEEIKELTPKVAALRDNYNKLLAFSKAVYRAYDLADDDEKSQEEVRERIIALGKIIDEIERS